MKAYLITMFILGIINFVGAPANKFEPISSEIRAVAWLINIPFTIWCGILLFS